MEKETSFQSKKELGIVELRGRKGTKNLEFEGKRFVNYKIHKLNGAIVKREYRCCKRRNFGCSAQIVESNDGRCKIVNRKHMCSPTDHEEGKKKKIAQTHKIAQPPMKYYSPSYNRPSPTGSPNALSNGTHIISSNPINNSMLVVKNSFNLWSSNNCNNIKNNVGNSGQFLEANAVLPRKVDSPFSVIRIFFKCSMKFVPDRNQIYLLLEDDQQQRCTISNRNQMDPILFFDYQDCSSLGFYQSNLMLCFSLPFGCSLNGNIHATLFLTQFSTFHTMKNLFYFSNPQKQKSLIRSKKRKLNSLYPSSTIINNNSNNNNYNNGYGEWKMSSGNHYGFESPSSPSCSNHSSSSSTSCCNNVIHEVTGMFPEEGNIQGMDYVEIFIKAAYARQCLKDVKVFFGNLNANVLNVIPFGSYRSKMECRAPGKFWANCVHSTHVILVQSPPSSSGMAGTINVNVASGMNRPVSIGGFRYFGEHDNNNNNTTSSSSSSNLSSTTANTILRNTLPSFNRVFVKN